MTSGGTRTQRERLRGIVREEREKGEDELPASQVIQLRSTQSPLAALVLVFILGDKLEPEPEPEPVGSTDNLQKIIQMTCASV